MSDTMALMEILSIPPKEGICLAISLGIVDYRAAFTLQRRLHERVAVDDLPGVLLLLEHPHVYTLGRRGSRDDILVTQDRLAELGVEVHHADRGGEVTYHGPGQVVIYLLMDLRRNRSGARLFAREFVHNIEEAVIATLAAYNLAGVRKEGAPGIYAADGPWQGAKVAALGLKIRGNGCTYHGVSLNVAMDLAPFSWINPCGYEGLATVDMQTLGAADARLDAVQDLLADQLIARFAGMA